MTSADVTSTEGSANMSTKRKEESSSRTMGKSRTEESSSRAMGKSRAKRPEQSRRESERDSGFSGVCHACSLLYEWGSCVKLNVLYYILGVIHSLC